ncbi:MAG: hypothetical protein NVV70_17150 [Cellulomonas sp.]|nr:hypothetical protein [Cellulomonas sp.]MCR6649775.1 hypothetical protein [Cellulomonas sp.]
MKADRPVGWHERRPRLYAYWDGGAWTATLPERHLYEYRREGVFLAGAPVRAVVHGRQPKPLFPRPGRRAAYLAGAVAVCTGLWFVNPVVAVLTFGAALVFGALLTVGI